VEEKEKEIVTPKKRRAGSQLKNEEGQIHKKTMKMKFCAEIKHLEMSHSLVHSKQE
jgi:hypothetical protein